MTAGLWTGQNTLGRHICIVGLIESTLCRKYGVEEDTSTLVWFCVKFWPHLNIATCGPPPFFFVGGGVLFVRNLSLGAVWNYGSHDSKSSLRDTKALLKRPKCVVTDECPNPLSAHSFMLWTKWSVLDIACALSAFVCKIFCFHQYSMLKIYRETHVGLYVKCL